MQRTRPFLVALAALVGALALDAPTARAEGADRASIRAAVDAWTTPPPSAEAARRRAPPAALRRDMRQGWAFEGRVAALRQFETGIDGGGRMQVDRLFAQLDPSYSPRPGMPFTVSFGYRFDGFDFGGRATGAFPARPWSDVHTLGVGVPLFVPVSPRLFVLAVPVLRTTIEEGASFDDGITGGGFVGASWKVNERLRIGPGIGVLTELEDDPTVFPVLLVDWTIAPRVRLKTGRGLGATQGPGVFLEYEPDRRWRLALGGRFDKLRFRLDEHGVAPGGVGEESSFAAVFAATWRASRRVELAASLGLSLGGELRLEDRDGNLLVRTDHDAAIFAGFGLTLRL